MSTIVVWGGTEQCMAAPKLGDADQNRGAAVVAIVSCLERCYKNETLSGKENLKKKRKILTFSLFLSVFLPP